MKDSQEERQPMAENQPPAEYFAHMRKFGEEDIRAVIREAIEMLRPHLAGAEEAERVRDFGDLRESNKASSPIDQCVAALWQILVYIKASDTGRGTVTTRPIWSFLVEEARQQHYISDESVRDYRQNAHRYGTPRAKRWRAWHRTDSRRKNDSDLGDTMADLTDTFLASGSFASGHSGGGGSFLGGILRDLFDW